MASSTVGTPVGVLRDGDKPVPIVARITPLAETATELLERTVEREHPVVCISTAGVSAATLRAEDSFLMRRNRVRTITVQANAPPGETATSAFNAIRGDIESIPLPPGYELEWGGNTRSMKLANDMVISRFPIALLVMIIATLMLFGMCGKCWSPG